MRDGDRDDRFGCPEDYNAPDLFHMIENYCMVLSNDQSSGMLSSVISSLAIAVPSTIIPISIASFAAYAFAWIDFKGRTPLFIGLRTGRWAVGGCLDPHRFRDAVRDLLAAQLHVKPPRRTH